jgi:D-tyrosyl-tRNA(Tyr) deacylase
MRIVVQRAARASVSVAGEVLGGFDEPGLVLLVGVTHTDTSADAEALARKAFRLRIMAQEKSAEDLGAPVLVVSQFTLYGSTAKGRRPSWLAAAGGAVAEPLVDHVVATLRAEGARVETGRFGADMAVELVNDGPMTLILESADSADAR